MNTITNIGTNYNGRDLSVSASVSGLRCNLGQINHDGKGLYFSPNNVKTGGPDALAVVNQYMAKNADALTQKLASARSA